MAMEAVEAHTMSQAAIGSLAIHGTKTQSETAVHLAQRLEAQDFVAVEDRAERLPQLGQSAGRSGS